MPVSLQHGKSSINWHPHVPCVWYSIRFFPTCVRALSTRANFHGLRRYAPERLTRPTRGEGASEPSNHTGCPISATQETRPEDNTVNRHAGRSPSAGTATGESHARKRNKYNRSRCEIEARRQLESKWERTYILSFGVSGRPAPNRRWDCTSFSFRCWLGQRRCYVVFLQRDGEGGWGSTPTLSSCLLAGLPGIRWLPRREVEHFLYLL